MTLAKAPRVAWILAGLLALDTLVRLASCAEGMPERRAHATEAGTGAPPVGPPASGATPAPVSAPEPPVGSRAASPAPRPSTAPPAANGEDLRRSLADLQAMGRAMANGEPRECYRLRAKALGFARAIARDSRAQGYALGIETERDARRCVSCIPDAIDACDRLLEALR